MLRASFRYPELSHQLIGPAGHRALSEMWLTAFPDLQLTVRGLSVAQNKGVELQSVARGTHSGPLRLGGVHLAPTGRSVEMGYQHTLEISGGRIMSISPISTWRPWSGSWKDERHVVAG